MLAPNLTIKPGDQLDHFQIDSVVAASGMATVFRARDLNTGQLVAIKIPHPEVESDPALYDRFLREEEIGQRIDRAMEQLSPRERLIFELKHKQGLRLRAIGEVLGTTEETVKNSLFRATRKLRAQLGELL